jgi:hypothetical protein
MFAPAQADFAVSLLDAGRPVPAGLTAPTGTPPVKRFAVYRNNVVIGLVNALRARFPAVEAIVGGEFFAAMARAFVAAHPPASPILMFYGDAFPDFLARFALAADLPYLADVARLEAARTHAYHAADMAPVEVERLAALSPDALAATRVVFHPSVTVVRSSFPIVTIWSMNSGEAELRPIDDWRGEDALVARRRWEVEVRKLPPGGAAFLLALRAGQDFAEAADRGLADAREFDLAGNLAGLIDAGLLGDLVVPKISKDISS